MYSVFEASLFEKVKVGIEPAIGLCRIIAVAWTALKVQYCYEEKNGTSATEYTFVLIYLLRCFWATLRPTLPINHSRMMAGCLDKPMGHLWLSFGGFCASVPFLHRESTYSLITTFVCCSPNYCGHSSCTTTINILFTPH